MKYYSTNRNASPTTYGEAVIRGLAPDFGLYYPEEIPLMPKGLIGSGKSLHEISFEAIKHFVGAEISNSELQSIVENVLNFPLPIVEIDQDIFSLELWHGPTAAFKDVGARFLSRNLSYFLRNEDKEVIVLVATSGDTGSAVASGFLNVDGIKVVILYPQGKVSEIQEKQLTTMGNNITALEVNGTFDDCQKMVKQAFNNEELRQQLNLSSANSINIARFLPQMFYYFWAYEQLTNKQKPLAFSVPSGNFGNLTAGLFAKKMGLPVHQFIAATNANNVVPEFLETGIYRPRPSIATISNAMDIGDPSNFVRITELYDNNLASIRNDITGLSFTDDDSKSTMKAVFNEFNYITDPHGALAYKGLKNWMVKNGGQGIFLETAHPAKFIDVVENAIENKIEIPNKLNEYLKKEKKSILIGNKFEELKTFLLNF
jgi:threonine synthase